MQENPKNWPKVRPGENQGFTPCSLVSESINAHLFREPVYPKPQDFEPAPVVCLGYLPPRLRRQLQLRDAGVSVEEFEKQMSDFDRRSAVNGGDYERF